MLEIIDYIMDPEQYIKMNVRMPKGILLYGPPGTGKTLFAKATATEAGIPCIYCSGSEFVEIYVGQGSKRVRELFAEARSIKGPCMIFIDEIDAIGYKRNSKMGAGFSNRESETTLNQLLSEMDGFEENEQILVIGATNLIENIDPALQRPGRFDHIIKLNYPDVHERFKIIEINLRNKPHLVGIQQMGKIATMMENCSGADIENVINLAAMQAIRISKMNGRGEEARINGDQLIDHVKQFVHEKFTRFQNV